MGTTILLVEDEDDLRASVAYAFEREGFEVLSTASGMRALELARVHGPALIVLDVLLPDLLGTEVCRQLRAQPETRRLPIIMLSARSGEPDRVSGFDAGADDYLAKPFSVRELVLRVRAKLRRVQAVELPTAPVTEALTIDHVAHRVFVAGREVKLTALEFRLLSTLEARAGRVQSRDTLLAQVWESAPEITGRSVDTSVMRLRQKLGKAGDLIVTVRGVGYRFFAPDADG